MTERKRTNRRARDYPVGYGKPPAEHQFKKGQPRPPRKPKEDKPTPSFQDYLSAELEETMRIVENGVEQHVPKGKALAKAAINGAIKEGDPRRLRDFLPKLKVQEDVDFSEIDLAIVARFMDQLLKQNQPPPSYDSGNDDEDGTNGEAKK